MGQVQQIWRNLTLSTCNFDVVIPMQHVLVLKESTQRDLSFELHIKI